MQNRISFLIAIALLISLATPFAVLAEDDDLFDYHAANMELNISNKFDVVPTSADYVVDYTSAELTWFPRDDYRQEVYYITTEPESNFSEDNGFSFEWKRPSQTSFVIEENSRLLANSEFLKVYEKISFPIKDLDSAYAPYLEPREIIDINEPIKQQAADLLQGEDDLYLATSKIALWVEDNVEYNITTLTAEATQKASWVMENRQGVCDEITSLFIAMCRSVGIPARFVTGIAYSNVNLQNNGWGPHGWAEVYFPGVGWVPFDITYKELGFVDASHIKLKTSTDAKENSINYATKSRNTEIKPDKLNFKVKVLDLDYKIKPLLKLSSEVVQKEVGFGSYNLLLLNVNNPQGYYVTSRITLANVNEIEIIGDNPQQVILKPHQEKRIYWLIKVNSVLQPNYIYTFPLKIFASAGETEDASFKSAEDYERYSEERMKMFIMDEPPEGKPYSSNVFLSCSFENNKKNSVYLNESVNVTCSVDNSGQLELQNLMVCLEDNCSKTVMSIRDIKFFKYTKKFETLGVKTLVFRVASELVSKSYYTTIDISDRPLIEIANLSFPEDMNYNDTSQIKFLLEKKSNNIPKNIRVYLDHKLIHEEWFIQEMDRNYDFTVILKGESLNLDQNNFNITVSYIDEQGEPYSVKDEFSILLNKPTLFQKALIWMHMLEQKITGWFEQKITIWFSNI
jgi:transglutaminase-like putative cysteine protease